MRAKWSPVVVIPNFYEVWQGVASLARVRELDSIGIPRSKIAERFQVTTQAIRDAEARAAGLARDAACGSALL